MAACHPFVSSRGHLLVLLLLQLVVADALRWPLTTAAIRTNYEYLLGQEVIASENWRREGALAAHFIPSRSIDQNLPEWPYRDVYWRDYLSQPALSWALHYGTTRLFPQSDPVLIGKILAQIMVAAGVLFAAPLLLDAFGFTGALTGLSFLIWGQPFLVWFVDGYYSTTPAMVCQLILTAWCVAFFVREYGRDHTSRSPRWTDIAIAFGIAFLGTWSEWVALFGNAVAASAFGVLGAVEWARHRRIQSWRFVTIVLALGVGSALAEATTVAMYSSKVGLRFYIGAFMDRVNVRTGDTPFRAYTSVLIRQMQTGWPRGLLLAMSGMLIVVSLWSVARLLTKRDSASKTGAAILFAVLVGFGGGVTYCYRLTNLVTIHWWFIGTWTVGWMMTICAFDVFLRSMAARIVNKRWHRLVSIGLSCALWIGVTVPNYRFVDLRPPDRSASDTYRMLAAALPSDGRPLVVADLPSVFVDYPFVTAYLRRPLLRFEAPGLVFKEETTEDAAPALRSRGDEVYVLYDRLRTECGFPDTTPVAWVGVAPVAVCRATVDSLTLRPPTWSKPNPAPDITFRGWLSKLVAREEYRTTSARTVTLTRLIDQALKRSAGIVVDGALREQSAALAVLAERWQHFGGTRHSSAPGEFSIWGVVARGSVWHLLVSASLSQAEARGSSNLGVRVNGNMATIDAPYQALTDDGAAVLSFGVMTILPIADSRNPVVRVELTDKDGHTVGEATTTVVSAERSDATDAVLNDALVFFENRCAGPPGAPGDLHVVSNHDRTVVLSWEPSGGRVAQYVLEAGTASGLADVSSNGLSAATSVSVPDVRPGTYYARVRARGACGTGAPSNEIVVVVQ